MGYNIFAESLNIGATGSEHWKKVKSEFALRQHEFGEKLDVSFTHLAEAMANTYCNHDFALIAKGLQGRLKSDVHAEEEDAVRFYHLNVVGSKNLFAKYTAWKQRETEKQAAKLRREMELRRLAEGGLGGGESNGFNGEEQQADYEDYEYEYPTHHSMMVEGSHTAPPKAGSSSRKTPTSSSSASTSRTTEASSSSSSVTPTAKLQAAMDRITNAANKGKEGTKGKGRGKKQAADKGASGRSRSASPVKNKTTTTVSEDMDQDKKTTTTTSSGKMLPPALPATAKVNPAPAVANEQKTTATTTAKMNRAPAVASKRMTTTSTAKMGDAPAASTTTTSPAKPLPTKITDNETLLPKLSEEHGQQASALKAATTTTTETTGAKGSRGGKAVSQAASTGKGTAKTATAKQGSTTTMIPNTATTKDVTAAGRKASTTTATTTTTTNTGNTKGHEDKAIPAGARLKDLKPPTLKRGGSVILGPDSKRSHAEDAAACEIDFFAQFCSPEKDSSAKFCMPGKTKADLPQQVSEGLAGDSDELDTSAAATDFCGATDFSSATDAGNHQEGSGMSPQKATRADVQPLPSSILSGLLQAKHPIATLLQDMLPALNAMAAYGDQLLRAYRLITVKHFEDEALPNQYEIDLVDFETACIMCRICGSDVPKVCSEETSQLRQILLNSETDAADIWSHKEENLGDLLDGFLSHYLDVRDLLPSKVRARMDVFRATTSTDMQTARAQKGIEKGPALHFFLVSNKSTSNLKELSPLLTEKAVVERMGDIMDKGANYVPKLDMLLDITWETFRRDIDYLRHAISTQNTINTGQAGAKLLFVNDCCAAAAAVLRFLGAYRSTKSDQVARKDIVDKTSANRLCGGLISLRDEATMEKSVQQDINVQGMFGKLNNLCAVVWRKILVPVFIEKLDKDVFEEAPNRVSAELLVTSHRMAEFALMDKALGLQLVLNEVNLFYARGDAVAEEQAGDCDFMSDDGAGEINEDMLNVEEGDLLDAMDDLEEQMQDIDC
ncbi:unnamed protein product [Amoebophrya sp. A25]|nr:unnamed protein product [Amoebophrya sp. A25]|eukprot:GSA25T00019269001.1